MKKKKAAIAIPIYKNELSKVEKISITQLFRVLNKYDVYLVCPKKLIIEIDVIKNEEYKIIYFDDKYFENIEGYSQLCLSSEFYKRFIEYKYILLYQLDAFVFDDKLEEFCDRGYDYIGAPVPKLIWPELNGGIGNGGFSLRKIDSMLELLKYKKRIISIIEAKETQEAKKEILKNEDKFIAYAMKELRQEGEIFILPSKEEAFEFSIEFNINGIYDDVENHLPFGTHRWYKYKFKSWWPIIEKYGYYLSDEEKIELEKIGQDKWYMGLVLERILKTGDVCVDKIIREISQSKSFSIWGLGKQYENNKSFLSVLGINIVNLYDKKIVENRGNELTIATSNIIAEKYPILIMSTKYLDEISETIEKTGKKRGVDYFTIGDLKACLIKKLQIDKNGEVDGM